MYTVINNFYSEKELLRERATQQRTELLASSCAISQHYPELNGEQLSTNVFGKVSTVPATSSNKSMANLLKPFDMFDDRSGFVLVQVGRF